MRVLTLVLLLGWLHFDAAVAAGRPAVAVLMSASGRCEVAPVGAGNFEAARVGMTLTAGDVVAVREGSATLLRADGRVETVEAGKSVRLEPRVGGDAPSGALGRLWQALLNRATTVMSGTRILSEAGAVRGLPAGRIDLLSPRNTALLAPPARVAWEPHPAVGTYRVRISDGNGSVVWSAYTSGTQAAVSASPGLFEAGAWYFVRVTDGRRGGVASDEAYFRVMTDTEKRQALSDVETVKGAFSRAVGGEAVALAVGGIFEHHELLDDALATYRGAGAGADLARAIDFVHLKNGRRWAMR
ncbi:MAG: hypothetical protein HY816_13650 [Candidatus Wallbacteria bacterium]|nr:hypothetical protein [Candidatus Wallbacteria bacterium]